MTRSISPAESLAGIAAGAAPAPRGVTALQRLAGNDATTRLLTQRGHRQGASGDRPGPRSDAVRPVQRAVGQAVAERPTSGRAPRAAEVPVQRRPVPGAAAGARVPATGRRAGADGPAAARVVQRVPWPDPAAARQNMLDRGWQQTEDGGWTRGPVSEAGEAAGGQRPEAAQPEQQQEAGGDDAFTLRVLVRKNASFRDADYLQNVGHSWVAFYKGDKFHSSAGFYPRGGQINEAAPLDSVPGEVRMNHDDPSNATTELSVPLTQKQFSKAQEYIQTNLNRKYNVLSYNCTDFAVGVHKAATGHSPPGRNLLLPNNPNDLHSGIKKRNKSKK